MTKDVKINQIHTHSDGSVLDGGQTVESILKYAKENDVCIALTDHGNMINTYKYHIKAKEMGVRHILGCEFYMCDKYEDKENNHLILLAKNNTGLKNLYKLQYEAYMKGFYYKPRIDIKTLRNHSEGLICTSACVGGIIPKTYLKGDIEGARRYIDIFTEIFGEDFYIEITPNDLDIQKSYNKWIESLNLDNVVIGNDAHYTHRDFRDIHDTMICMQTKKLKDDKERFRFTVDAHMKEYHEINYYLNVVCGLSDEFIKKAIENTNSIEKKCDVNIEFEGYSMPHVSDNPKKTLAELCNKGFKERLNEGSFEGIPTNDVVERIKYELKVIDDKGFSDYFCIVYDYLKWCRDNNIATGVGRGSVAGSEVAFILRISDLEPLKYGLLFERFLNPERMSVPDIDSDICHKRRPELIQYLADKYGRENVCTIMAEGRMESSAVLRKVLGVYGYETSFVNMITKTIPKGLTLKESCDKSDKLKSFFVSNPIIRRDCFALESYIAYVSKHAAGLVIAGDEIYNHIPVMRDEDDKTLLKSQWDKKKLEVNGLIKHDLLGLKLPTIFDMAVKNINKLNNTNYKTEEFKRIDLEDECIYKQLNSGQLLGVFQFSEYAGKMTILNAKPTCFEDIIACESICRPGVIEAEMFLKNKSEGYKRTNFKILDDILEPTFGAIVYQEQTMMILHKIGGFTLGEADSMRKVKSLEPYRERFVDYAIKTHQITKEFADEMFNRLDLGLMVALVKHF